jgi:hypothetical protein
MSLTWKTTSATLTIEQRASAAWVYPVIGVVGTLMTPICLLVELMLVAEAGRGVLSLSFYTAELLEVHALASMGIAMMMIGFSSRSRRNAQGKVVFSNPRQAVLFGPGDPGTEPCSVRYPEVAHLGTSFQAQEHESPASYTLFLVLGDGARHYLACFHEERQARDLAEAIAEHAGFAMRAYYGSGITREASRRYAPLAAPVPRPPSAFVWTRDEGGAERIGLHRARTRLRSRVLATYILLLFLLVPLHLAHRFLATPASAEARWLAMGFIAIWLAILLLPLLVWSCEHALVLDGRSLRITVRLRRLPFVRSEVLLLRDQIAFVRTNRHENDFASLSIGLRPGVTVRLPALFSLASLASISSMGRPRVHEQEVHVWVLPPSEAPGLGPDLHDLRSIEQRIQRRLGIVELPVAP